MNRREFLIAVGAVPIAVYFANTPAAALSDEQKIDLMFKHLDPWQLHLWNMLEQGKRVIYATSTQKNAQRIYNLLERHKNLFCTSIGASICGRGADLIVVDDYVNVQDTYPASYDEWYESSLRTRLLPEGKIEWVYT